MVTASKVTSIRIGNQVENEMPVHCPTQAALGEEVSFQGEHFTAHALDKCVFLRIIRRTRRKEQTMTALSSKTTATELK